MFENLKLSQINGLKECELTGLGHINIICGKNNSGKSTILAAINKTNNRAHGKPFSEVLLEKFYKNSIKSFHFRGQPQTAAAYKDCLRDAFQSKTIWYEDQAVIFIDTFIKFSSKRELLRHHAFPTYSNVFSDAYQNCYSINTATILIPPKRKLDLTSKIQANEGIHPNGAGVLNKLFYLRNQTDGTQEKDMYNKLRGQFSEISNGYNFDIRMSDQNEVMLNFSNKNGEWISAVDSGLGLQDLLAILWFASSPENTVLLIEEPESHIHPEMQRKLLEFFRNQTHKQFFLTTHSNVFVNSAYADKVFLTQYNSSIEVQDATSRAFVLNDLGYSVTDNLISDLVILVEGPTDAPIIEELLIKMDVYSKHNIKIWPLGGDIMDQLDLSIFTQNYKILALIDKDPLSASIRKDLRKRVRKIIFQFIS